MRNDVRSISSTHKRVHIHPEEVGVNGFITLGRVHYGGAHKPLERHIHANAFEICYLARGRQTYRVGDRLYHLRGNDVYVTFPDEDHDTGGFPEEKSLLYYIIVRAARGRESFLGLPRAEGRQLCNALLHLSTRHFHASPALRPPLEAMIHHWHNDDPLCALRLRQEVIAFLLLLLDAAKRAEPSPQEGIARAQQYVREHVPEEIALEDLADTAGLSLSRFKAVFRETVGMPPREYVLREKIAAAQQLLAQPDRDITSVAYALGFSSSQYFATVFRRYVGATPRTFRAASKR